MEARFSGCALATHWLPHTLVQIFFCLGLVHKKFWCSLSSLSIQTGLLAVTFGITLFITKFLLKLSIDPSCSIHELYKGRLQSLTKKSSTVAGKKLSPL